MAVVSGGDQGGPAAMLVHARGHRQPAQTRTPQASPSGRPGSPGSPGSPDDRRPARPR
ncbi:hypothetical protein [Amycolatopsis viridis]|uniref:Uncharacterized protein n=1 Tax=Amycolatopsis viridis TaxID=185678 RepID=A0ABX0SVA2_9PSEU|nr:hypothetical protein [Amycolatopsis viridis]NIH79420.1 hypothetical protein [Amycolatopsis viridis]